METQTEISFPTDSPLNIEKLSKQNKRLYDFLMTGKAINCLSDDKIKLGIGYLNSRISDLINKHKVAINKKYITVNETTVVEYSIKK